MKVAADTTVCAMSGQCALNVPEVFGQSEEDGTVVIQTEEPAPEFEQRVRRAVLTCPSGALRIVE